MPSNDWQALGAKREPHSDGRITVSLAGWKLKMTGEDYLKLETLLGRAAIAASVLVFLAVILLALYPWRHSSDLEIVFDGLAVVLRVIGIIVLFFFLFCIVVFIGIAVFLKLTGTGCVDCPRCHTRQPRWRMPTSVEQIKNGGCTCRVCGCEMDTLGHEVTYE
jgi:hypothetical protein